MNLSAPFIHRPVMTTLVVIASTLVGLISYFHLPVSNLPDVDYPTLNVTVSFPGASPEIMANNVASPLEKEFMTIPGVMNVTSSNTLGKTSIVLQFDIDKGMDSAAQDVEACISRASSKLPKDLPNNPTYKKVNPSDYPILYIALTSDSMNGAQLYTYGYNFLGQRLSMISGVAQVQVYGSPYAVRIQVDPEKLASLGISLEDVVDSIQKHNPSIPTGQLDGNEKILTIDTKGQLTSGPEFSSLIIKTSGSASIRIQDLGVALDSLSNDKLRLQYFDQGKLKPAVVLAVERQPGANTVQISEAIEKILPQIRAQLPSDLNMKIVYDRSQTIKESIQEVNHTLLIAFALVVFVVYLYLANPIDTLIPSLVLPFAVIVTFPFMYFLGYSIDNLSLLAFILATGFIVDDAIVVLENIVRRVEEGESAQEAALVGSKQISPTILSMTLSLIAVFIPLLFMSGLVGKIFREFAITLSIVTLMSGVAALSFTPMLCSRLLQKRKKEVDFKGLERWSYAINQKMQNIYRPCLKWALNHKKTVLATGILSVVSSGILFIVLPKDFIPDEDIGFIIAYTQAQEGTSPEKMCHYQDKVHNIIRDYACAESFVSVTSFTSYREGIFFTRLVSRDARPSSTQIIQQLYGKLGNIPGVNTFVKNIPLIDLALGTANKGAYQYVLQGLDASILYSVVIQMMEKMKGLPGFQAINTDLEIKNPELKVKVLRDQAAIFGITAEQIENALSYAFGGGKISQIQTSLDQYDVIVELLPSFQKDPEALSKIYLRSSLSGKLVPLSAVASWKWGVGPASINHMDQFPSATISFSLAPGMPLGNAIQNLEAVAQKILPYNVSGKLKGSAEAFQESIANINILLAFAVFAIYVVLGILYESFIHPLTVLSTLPSAVMGGLFTLFLCNMPMSLYGYLGIVLLIGIVKKNGIMVVDYALDNIRTKQAPAEQAIFEACLVRFRPIMMTTAAAVMGAIPLVWSSGAGSGARRPLGLVIIGGLLFSQLITLFLTPVVYLYLERFQKKSSHS